METMWMHKRLALWDLLECGIAYTDQQLAERLGMSRSWVQKWRKRLQQRDRADPRDYHRIPRRVGHIRVPLTPAAPMQVMELDFTDVASATSDTTDKRQHQVEALAVVDTGTSLALDIQVSDRYDAEWTLGTLVDILTSTGCPQQLRFDRDPRFVASWGMDGFPSALMRFLWCVGIQPEVCPPRRPDRKPYVERFIRSLQEECLRPHRPATPVQAQHRVNDYRSFYNLERPNQALTCGNRPPSSAAGTVPALPRLPSVVNPDAWLRAYHQHGFRRRIRSNGSVTVDKHHYYIGKALAGQQALLVLEPPTCTSPSGSLTGR